MGGTRTAARVTAGMLLAAGLASCGSGTGDGGNISATAESPATTSEPEGEADRTLYGLDLSGLDLPSADPYEDFVAVTNDAGTIELETPESWEEVESADTTTDTGEPAYRVLVAPSRAAYDEMEGAGTSLLVTPDTGRATPEELLGSARRELTSACGGLEEGDYDDGRYQGRWLLASTCEEMVPAQLWVAFVGEDEGVIGYLVVAMATDADVGAAVRAVRTFGYLGST